MNKKTIEVVAAVMKENDLYFVAQRPNKGELALKWEFPGGKVEQNETNTDALVRELSEELNIMVKVNDFITTVRHEYHTFNLIMHVYQVSISSGKISLNEHLDFKWLKKDQLYKIDLAEADKPVLSFIE